MAAGGFEMNGLIPIRFVTLLVQIGSISAAVLFQSPGDARLVQAVRRHLHLYAVTGGQLHPALAHFAADAGQDKMLIVRHHTEPSARQYRGDAAFHLNVVFLARLYGF